MSEHNQFVIPPSFVALFVERGRIKPTAGRDFIARRYDLCEDLASALTEHASNLRADLHVNEDDVLERCHRGLLRDGSGVSEAEARWIVRRLAELLGWDCPPLR